MDGKRIAALAIVAAGITIGVLMVTGGCDGDDPSVDAPKTEADLVPITVIPVPTPMIIPVAGPATQVPVPVPTAIPEPHGPPAPPPEVPEPAVAEEPGQGKTKDPPWFTPIHVNPPITPDEELADAAPGVPLAESDYERRWRTLEVKSGWHGKVAWYADRISANRGRYEASATGTGVPWYVVAVLHQMESGLQFDKHLHNGNTLARRTTWVPKGRIPHKDPPYTWEESAADAITYDKLDRVDDWSVHHMLYTIERYNGLGYLKYHKDVPTPYLWSGSNHYVRGKYVADGKWSSTAVSKQVGAAVTLKELVRRGVAEVR